MLTSVQYLPRKQVEALWLRSHQAVISITQPDDPPAGLSGEPHEILRVAFFDVIGERTLKDGRHVIPITVDQAESIAATVERWGREAKALEVICHCEAGLSRSAAVARFIEERFSVPIINGTAEYANLAVRNALRQAAKRLSQDDTDDAGSEVGD